MREKVIMNALCLVIVSGSIAVAAWALLTGQVEEQGIDGLFLILICLSVATVFAPIPLRSLRRGSPLWNLLRRKRAEKPPVEAEESEQGRRAVQREAV